jgi:hypothetical protein
MLEFSGNGKVLEHVNDVSHVKPLLKDYMKNNVHIQDSHHCHCHSYLVCYFCVGKLLLNPRF